MIPGFEPDTGQKIPGVSDPHFVPRVLLQWGGERRGPPALSASLLNKYLTVWDCLNKYSKIQTEQSKRLGYWMDWDNSYYTMSDENNYSIWTFLKNPFEHRPLKVAL